MVVGHGLIASAFDIYNNNNSVIIFASGVSNSKEQKEEEFQREKDLISSFSRFSNKKFVYFSTCSISDPSMSDSMYVQHKINMENHVQSLYKKHFIIRLPNVIGISKNPNTFFNFIKNKILNNETITIESLATRYLVDIDDLKVIVPLLFENKENINKTFNVTFNNKERVSKIIDYMEEIIGKKSQKIFLSDTVGDYDIDNSELLNCLFEVGISENTLISKNYNFNLLKKYLR